MGYTFIEFKEQGFDAKDFTLEVWLALLVDEIDCLPELPAWLRETRDDWEVQATGHFGYGVMPDLDLHLREDTQRMVILKCSSAALKRLTSLGDPISKEAMNGIRDWGEGYQYTRDVPAHLYLQTAENFIRLLTGIAIPS